MPKTKVIRITESTQTELKAMLAADRALPHLTYVQALEQTGGRGRQGNVWVSRPGNLYLSVLYRYADQGADVAKNLTWMPLWVGSQVRRALLGVGSPKAPSEIQLKWPNDLYFKGRYKFGGVLCEKVGGSLVVGIGVNIDHTPSPEEMGAQRSVTSLTEILDGRKVALSLVVDAIMVHLAKKFDLDDLRMELASVMIPRVGSSIAWVDQTLAGRARADVSGGADANVSFLASADSSMIDALRPNKAKCSGIVVGLGGFGELQVNSGDQIVQLFSEEVTLKSGNY